MAKPLTPTMRARLIAAYDHAGDLLRDGFHPLAIIRSLQADHGAFYGYATCTDKLRCAGVEISSNWKNHAGMLEAWMNKAAARVDEHRADLGAIGDQAPVRTSEPFPVIGGQDNALGCHQHTTEAHR